MASAFVVLEVATPPNSAKVVALFVVGSTQDSNTTKSRAEAFRDSHYPTSVVNPCTVESYNGPIVINV